MTESEIVARAVDSGGMRDSVIFNPAEGAVPTIEFRLPDLQRFATLLMAQQKAEPVIGELYATPPSEGDFEYTIWWRHPKGDLHDVPIGTSDTEAEALAFIESCRPKQEPAACDCPHPAACKVYEQCLKQETADQSNSELPSFEDSKVQIAYQLLVDNESPPNPEEHWEGWTARRIVAALFNTSPWRSGKCKKCDCFMVEHSADGTCPITNAATECPQNGERSGYQEYALNVRHRDRRKAADAFWQYWRENGATHKHGYYESTWGAINQAIRYVGIIPHKYNKPRIEVTGTTYLSDCDALTPPTESDEAAFEAMFGPKPDEYVQLSEGGNCINESFKKWVIERFAFIAGRQSSRRDSEDAERFVFLFSDHDDPEIRERLRGILENACVKSVSNMRLNIDAAIAKGQGK